MYCRGALGSEVRLRRGTPARGLQRHAPRWAPRSERPACWLGAALPDLIRSGEASAIDSRSDVAVVDHARRPQAGTSGAS